MMVANLWGVVSVDWLLPWAGAVAVRQFRRDAACPHQSITCVGRSGRRVPNWLLVGEVAVRAARVAQRSALSLPHARSGDPGHHRLDHGRPRRSAALAWW